MKHRLRLAIPAQDPIEIPQSREGSDVHTFRNAVTDLFQRAQVELLRSRIVPAFQRLRRTTTKQSCCPPALGRQCSGSLRLYSDCFQVEVVGPLTGYINCRRRGEGSRCDFPKYPSCLPWDPSSASGPLASLQAWAFPICGASSWFRLERPAVAVNGCCRRRVSRCDSYRIPIHHNLHSRWFGRRPSDYASAEGPSVSRQFSAFRPGSSLWQ